MSQSRGVIDLRFLVQILGKSNNTSKEFPVNELNTAADLRVQIEDNIETLLDSIVLLDQLDIKAGKALRSLKKLRTLNLYFLKQKH